MMNPKSKVTDSTSCCHVDEWKKKEGIEVYHYIHAYYVSCVVKGSRAKKAKDAYCHICKRRPIRMQVCMSCSFFGCVDGGHMNKHARENKHCISMDIMFGKVYCNECEDYMYDEELENISKNCKSMSAKKLGIPYNPPFHPTKAEVKKISDNFNFVKLHDTSLIGIKGVQNLGHTCYISTILSALAHTPILRDHYLSEEHKCRTFSKKDRNKNRMNSNGETNSNSGEDRTSGEYTNSVEETNYGKGLNVDESANSDEDTNSGEDGKSDYGALPDEVTHLDENTNSNKYTNSNEDDTESSENDAERNAESNEDDAECNAESNEGDAESNKDDAESTEGDAESNKEDPNSDNYDTESNENDTNSNEDDTNSNKDGDINSTDHTNSNEDNTDSNEDNTDSNESNTDSNEDNTGSSEDNTDSNEDNTDSNEDGTKSSENDTDSHKNVKSKKGGMRFNEDRISIEDVHSNKNPYSSKILIENTNLYEDVVDVREDLSTNRNQNPSEDPNISEDLNSISQFPNPNKTTNPSEDSISNKIPIPSEKDQNLNTDKVLSLDDSYLMEVDKPVTSLGELYTSLFSYSQTSRDPDPYEDIISCNDKNHGERKNVVESDANLSESDANINSNSGESDTNLDESDANINSDSGESDTNSGESGTNSSETDQCESDASEEDPSEESESIEDTSNKYCMGCELSKVYEEFYRGNPRPCTFDSFIFTFIKNTPSFMFFTQEDAFEVFEHLIPKLHEGDCNPRKCTCIIGRVFNHVQRKDTVTVSSICNAINRRGEIIDGFFIRVALPDKIEIPSAAIQTSAKGISLSMDVDPTATKIADLSHKDTQRFLGGTPDKQIPQLNLLDLIERDLNILPIVKKCPDCTNENCMKTTYQRGFFLKLPVVFCFQRQSPEDGGIAFPEYLDMRKLIPTEVTSRDPSGLCDFGYTLYAVVEHWASKAARGGHYVAYVRQNLDRWFFIDDDKVEPITFERVTREVTPSILFYYKNVVDHACTTWMSKVKIPTQKQLDKQFQRI